jgi:hypothetical protein
MVKTRYEDFSMVCWDAIVLVQYASASELLSDPDLVAPRRCQDMWLVYTHQYSR